MATMKEQTFTAFTPEQAAQYAKDRGQSYPPELYRYILDFHGSNGNEAVLDVGTGPGKVVIDLLQHFQRGLGCDTGEQMIEQAKRDAARLGLSERTSWAVSGAETCADAFAGQQVDMITVAMAAHWFDMPKFYASAAKLLKPGGTLAMWTMSSYYVHPSMKNWQELDKILHNLEDGALAPYATHGNMVSRNAYRDLLLPWQDSHSEGLFERTSFEKKDWDLDGVPSAPPLPDGTPGPYLSGQKDRVSTLIKRTGSSSLIIRWRQAHPEKAHTDDDPIYVTARKLKEVMGEDDELSVGGSTTLLLLRRAA